MSETISCMTYGVEEILKSEFPEYNNVVALSVRCLLPSIFTSLNGEPYEVPTKEEKKEIAEALRKAADNDGEFSDGSENDCTSYTGNI